MNTKQLRYVQVLANEGIEEISKMPQVLQNVQFKFVGNIIPATSSLDRVILRIHVMDDTKE